MDKDQAVNKAVNSISEILKGIDIEAAVIIATHFHMIYQVGYEAAQDVFQAGCKPVEQFWKGQSLRTWPSGAAASRSLNIPRENISKAARGELQTAGGYTWSFLKKAEQIYIEDYLKKKRNV